MRFKLRESDGCRCGCGADKGDCFNLSSDVIPYYGQDHNYTDSAWQGEDPATNKKNYPAIRAAKTAGGYTHDITVYNYPTITTKGDAIMSYYNSYQESVCDKLSRVSFNEATKKMSKRRPSGGGKKEASFATRAWNTAGDVMDTLGNVPEYIGRGAGAIAGGLRGVASHIPGIRRFSKGMDYGSGYVRKRFGDNRY